MSKNTIQITVIDDSRREKCHIDCGLDWSLAEAISLARQRIEDRFGDKIQLAFRDLTQTANDDEALEWRQVIRDKELPLPLLLINGKLRIAGQFDIRQLMDSIETEMEIRAGK